MTSLSDALADGQGIERPFNCPVAEHDDTRASASVNVALGVWFCFSCGSSGTVEGHVPNPEDAIRVLAGQSAPRRYCASFLDAFDALGASRYWSGRYGPAVAERFRCGTHPVTGNPTYPLHDMDGYVLGVVQRQESREPKYLYPTGVRVSATFFCERLAHRSTVILCEGASDVMAVHAAMAKYPGRILGPVDVLGCFGAGLHLPQIEVLCNADPRMVVVAFDADQAGRAAAQRAAQSLFDEGFEFVVHDWETSGGHDPGDIVALGHHKTVMSGVLDTLNMAAQINTTKETNSVG